MYSAMAVACTDRITRNEKELKSCLGTRKQGRYEIVNSKDVIEIIETICDKLGIMAGSFSNLVPELAKYKITMAVFWIISAIAVIAVSIVAIVVVISRARKMIDDNRFLFTELADFPSVVITSILGGAAILAFTITLIVSIWDVIAWTTSPQVSAIRYVLSCFD